MQNSSPGCIRQFSFPSQTCSLRVQLARAIAVSFLLILGILLVAVAQAAASSFSFSTGNPDGKIGTLSRPASSGKLQTETADDFVLTQASVINQATFTGLLPVGASLSSISDVEIEIYHVFPGDSHTNRTLTVPTRVNSPGDVEIDDATRDGLDGSLAFTSTS